MVMIMVIDDPGSTPMQTIQASEFKARCLALMDQVAASGEILVVTKNGKPITKGKCPDCGTTICRIGAAK